MTKIGNNDMKLVQMLAYGAWLNPLKTDTHPP